MIELDDGFLRIENFENLLFVSLGVFGDFVARQLLARFGFAGRIADHAGKIADQKNHLMAELLKLLHLLDQHRVTQVQIRRGRIEPGFDAQRPAPLELGDQFFFRQNLDGAALDDFELRLQVGHRHVLRFAMNVSAGECCAPYRSFSSTSTMTPCSTTLSSATSNCRGSWVRKPRITVSFSMPITESNGPHMPTSVI